MRSFILPAFLPALALAAPVHEKRDDACPTMTFTYEGAVITAPYTGPGAPASCVTAAATAAQPCPTMTFTYGGVVITQPYTGPGTPQSCLTVGGTSSAPPAQTPTTTTTATLSSVATNSAGGSSASSVPPVSLPSPVSSTSATSSSAVATSTSSIAKGFNYGSSGQTEATFESQFNLAKNLVGTSGFTSARLYTMIQDGTTNSVIEAIPAAIATQTKLLLGLYYPNVDNEIAALRAAIATYGSAFADLVLGISVGSEDLYRNSPTGIAAGSYEGANPDQLVSFISSVRSAVSGTILSSKPIGHVDTWTAYVNASNTAVIDAIDFIGMDAYPYFQNTQANSIANGASLFQEAYQATVAVAQGKPVWITETGWPVSGDTEGQAVASTSNAETFWQAVGCDFAFDKINTFWYILLESASPSFAVSSGSTTPLYDLSCSA